MAGNETINEVAQSLGLEKPSPVVPEDIQNLDAIYRLQFSSEAVSLELGDPRNIALRGVLFLLTEKGPFYSRKRHDVKEYVVGPNRCAIDSPEQFIRDNQLACGGKELVELLLEENVAYLAYNKLAYQKRMQEEPDVHQHYDRDFHRKNAARARADFIESQPVGSSDVPTFPIWPLNDKVL